MPSAQHFMFARESSWGTWVTPDQVIPVTSVSIDAEQPIIVNNDTGGGRGQRPGVSGHLAVSGDVVTKLYPRSLGKLLRGMYGTRAKISSVSSATVTVSTWTTGTFTTPGTGTKITTATPHGLNPGDRITVAAATGGTPSPNGEQIVGSTPSATEAYLNLSSTVGATGGTVAKTSLRNKLLMDDNVATNSFSLQNRYSSTVAQSTLGAKITGYKLSAKAKEFTEFTISMAAKDQTTKGTATAYWADGTTPAPAVVDPTNMYALAGWNDGIAFVGGGLYLGGSVALTAGELVYTGGTMRHSIDNIELEVKTEQILDDYEVYKDSRLLGSMGDSKRTITLGWEPNFEVVDNEFYVAWKSGQTAVLKLLFQGKAMGAANVYEGFEWVFPLVRYDSAANPELNAEYAIQRVPVKAMAYVDPTLNVDHGLVITTPDDLTV